MRFEELDIDSKIVDQTRRYGFEKLTLVQEKSMREITAGRDIVAQAETGSGKTLAFALPILDRIKLEDNMIQALVLTPTRELCIQVAGVFQEFGKNLGVRVVSIYGGVGIEPQISRLRVAHVVVGTPGRLLDHIHRKTINLKNVRFFVLDETDKMLDMGFIDDVEKIIHYLPKEKQMLMFSATVSKDVQWVSKKYLRNPLTIRTKPLVDDGKLKQVYYDIYKQHDKFSLLVYLLKNYNSGLSIVFCGTRKETDIVAKNLRRQGINALGIHGGMSQDKRLKSLEALKKQKIDVLVATDVAARGLDIKNVTHVYNYDVPKTSKEYIHRIGRTARAGKNGVAITLLTRRDHDNFRRVQSDEKLKIKLAEFPKFEKIPFFRTPYTNRRNNFNKRS
ncbi:helicase SNF2 [Euryarchaeota archaeon ex4484_162]|nr:MAG: helicase SNF2 [Euryarchaeota archaeon ex4484_162]